ncbi:hypothetical protein [Bradyrhizobium zhanjiangense]|uniref:Uncharacterized protein n=1 Tax=Bradyrhizobium zhanjiangense TaxID=1325107 RepID=A0A4Q0STI4_9BRAD|nr:hypothetical protein [Bradyrhizobium zhanjiangense]RXH41739.1 hypothetical protein XH94_06270 [Bradyrhizobium zhanjiangense]
MSTEPAKVKQFAGALVKRSRELSEVMTHWEQIVLADDLEQFIALRQRVMQFIEFRQELVRRGLEISPAAARKWGDNDADRTGRSKLNADLEALQRSYVSAPVKLTSLPTRTAMPPGTCSCLGSRRWSLSRSMSLSCGTR